MAIIIKCKDCKKRLNGDTDPCPSCGATERRFIIDYWPDGRHGKRCQRYLDDSIKSLDIALQFDRETKLAIRERRNPETSESLPQYSETIDELIPDYMAYYRLQHRSAVNPVRQEKSFKEREDSIYRVSRTIGPMPVVHFTKSTATKYQLTRSKQESKRGTFVKNRTINKELTYMMSFFKYCKKERGINIEPEIEMLPYDRPEPAFLSPREIIKFIKAAQSEPFWYAYFLCCYTVGFRLTETTYLKKSDVDRANKIIKLVQKGGGEKIEPLNPILDHALKKLDKIKYKKDNPEGYYFLSKRTGRPVQNPHGAIERIAKRAGIKKHITPHMFRHSIATHMLAQETNMRTIQKMLGHADIATTQKYTHVVTDDIRRATKNMFQKMQKALSK